MSWSASY